MATKITRWTPDTCKCELQYSWDTEDTKPNRTLTFVAIAKCSLHSSLTDQIAYDTVFEENPRKNNTLKRILEIGPTALFDTLADGTRTLKNGISYSWVWSGTAPDRILTVTVSGITLTTQQRTTIQTALNTLFGVGKVVLA